MQMIIDDHLVTLVNHVFVEICCIIQIYIILYYLIFVRFSFDTFI